MQKKIIKKSSIVFSSEDSQGSDFSYASSFDEKEVRETAGIFMLPKFKI